MKEDKPSPPRPPTDHFRHLTLGVILPYLVLFTTALSTGGIAGILLFNIPLLVLLSDAVLLCEHLGPGHPYRTTTLVQVLGPVSAGWGWYLGGEGPLGWREGVLGWVACALPWLLLNARARDGWPLLGKVRLEG